MKSKSVLLCMALAYCLVGCRHWHLPFTERTVVVRYDTISSKRAKEDPDYIPNRTDSACIDVDFFAKNESVVIGVGGRRYFLQSQWMDEPFNLPRSQMIPKQPEMDISLEFGNGDAASFRFDQRFWLVNVSMFRDTLHVRYRNRVDKYY